MDEHDDSDREDNSLLPRQPESLEIEESSTWNGDPKQPPPKYRLIAVFIGAFFASADSSLLYVTQDRIARDFHNMAYAPLTVTSFNLGHCIALPVYGALSDRYGCKTILLYAYLLFGVGCALSGLTRSFPVFFLGRIIAGAGGAGMLDLFMVLVCEIYDAKSIAQLRGYVMATGTLGRSCGGPLGGILTDHIGWRWSLAGQTPVAITCTFFAWWLLPAGRRKLQETLQNQNEKPAVQSLDIPGIILFAVFMGSTVLVLDLGGHSLPWGHPVLLLLVLLGSLFGIAFAVNEKMRKEGQLIPPQLLMRSGLRSVFAVQALLCFALLGITSSLAPYYGRVENLSATSTAARLWIQTFGFAAGTLIGSHIVSRSQRYRKLSIVAALVSTTSNALMVVYWADGIDGVEIGYTMTAGFGAGILFATQFQALIQKAPVAQRATATGVYYLCQQAGIIVGAAVMASVTQALFRWRLVSSPESPLVDGSSEHVDRILRDPRSVNGLPSGVQAVVRASYKEAFGYATVLPLISILLVLAAVIAQREERV
ncbi:hypothetical protein FE257_006381 [Aspergillus nanangensis]|uniref:Major facilitator superfamily (MFS) profile domain-containing protein n=1 Tax=Aspergillus nanangensis TaxID=2582783 RepID=A0AAD4CZ65_ASPNN|nr:hypothetical protein FE257_006381 [Aspergillus nanangensis]